jgi:outer membrane protein assembly factor BamD (BamD/ComL family)
MGKAYFKGGNYQQAMKILQSCHTSFALRQEGEEALYLSGYMSMIKGLSLESDKFYSYYRAAYKGGSFIERIDRDLCYASALMDDHAGSLRRIEAYRRAYPSGKFMSQIDYLEKTVAADRSRTRKHLWISVLGSILIPGFGHFYTGHPVTGLMTLLTNGILCYLIYNGYRENDIYQMVFFGALELIMYQYSIYGAVRGVREHGRREPFYRQVKLGLSSSF